MAISIFQNATNKALVSFYTVDPINGAIDTSVLNLNGGRIQVEPDSITFFGSDNRNSYKTIAFSDLATKTDGSGTAAPTPYPVGDPKTTGTIIGDAVVLLVASTTKPV